MENRHLGWIAAWGVLAGIGNLGALTVWVAVEAANPRTHHIPLWPVWPLLGLGLISLYMTFAPVTHMPPFGVHVGERRVRKFLHLYRKPKPAPAAPPPPDPTTVAIVAFPWVDEDRQLVLTYRLQSSTPDHQERPWNVKCEIIHAGITREIVNKGYQYPATWMFRTFYPRDCNGAPPPEPGDYEIRWYRSLHDRATTELTGWRPQAITNLVVIRDGDGRLRVKL